MNAYVVEAELEDGALELLGNVVERKPDHARIISFCQSILISLD